MNRKVLAPGSRPAAIKLALAASAVLLVLAAGVYVLKTRTGPAQNSAAPVEDRPSPIAGFPTKPADGAQPTTLPARPSPAVVPEATEQTRTRSDSARDWAVIAATYNAFDAAAKRAASLRAQFADCSCSVFPREGEGPKFYVVVGSAMTRDVAEDLRLKAVSAGLPADTYVTRLVRDAPDPQ
jgi:hypothetical protein